MGVWAMNTITTKGVTMQQDREDRGGHPGRVSGKIFYFLREDGPQDVRELILC